MGSGACEVTAVGAAAVAITAGGYIIYKNWRSKPKAIPTTDRKFGGPITDAGGRKDCGSQWADGHEICASPRHENGWVFSSVPRAILTRPVAEISFFSQMRSPIDAQVARARTRERAGKTEEAVRLTTQLVESNPDELKAWLLRAHLHTLLHEYTKANSDLTRAIQMDATDPYVFFRRGLNLLALAEWEAAIQDFSAGLSLGDPDYADVFHFARAEALISLSRREDALRDLASVPGETTMWTYRLRTRDDLIAEYARG